MVVRGDLQPHACEHSPLLGSVASGGWKAVVRVGVEPKLQYTVQLTFHLHRGGGRERNRDRRGGVSFLGPIQTGWWETALNSNNQTKAAIWTSLFTQGSGNLS
ncbi:hypothetical protein GOP47_0028843 [Adiantum capillus-veneris]|nr:hypothetical protein GOP47_0028843 [Adiantum capillus-veneris]